ncbi:MAG: RNA 3'-terminal phosphate cyclase [Planctomycetota bacterium]
MLHLDGSRGEGGGQVFRSALALSLCTGTPFRMSAIRARRPRTGLRPQHLAAVRAAATVGNAEVTGDERGSEEITFRPRGVVPGRHHFQVGTAGSACLVLQTILPPLLTAGGPSALVLEGGTHNPHAPPFDYLDRVVHPLLARMGPRVVMRLERHGFAPEGGGRFTVEVEPVERLEGLTITERGGIRETKARALVSDLPLHIAERELKVVARKLRWADEDLRVEVVERAGGAGNVLLLEIACRHITELFTAFGRIGTRAETVAAEAVRAARRYLRADVPVGEHLADQLLLPLALAGGGAYRTLPLSSHTQTQIDLLGAFLDTSIEVLPSRPGSVLVEVRS